MTEFIIESYLFHISIEFMTEYGFVVLETF